MTTMVLCPKCHQLEGPLVNNFLDHMREAHSTTPVSYSANTGQIRMPGDSEATALEFTDVPDTNDWATRLEYCPTCEGNNIALSETGSVCFDCDAQDYE